MRKLIRPSKEELEKIRKQYSHVPVTAHRRTPADFTGEEGKCLQRHSTQKTPMVVTLASGEEIKGWIEYFDLNFVRVTVNRGPNRFIYKKDILHIMEDPAFMRKRRFPRGF